MHAWLIKGMRLLYARIIVQAESMVCHTMMTGCMKEPPGETSGATYEMQQHLQSARQATCMVVYAGDWALP